MTIVSIHRHDAFRSKGRAGGPGEIDGNPRIDDDKEISAVRDNHARFTELVLPHLGDAYSLARWITDSEQGAGSLLARVIVNRLWQHHFGRGIVATASDFGSPGERPTHPELLDWLAGKLIEDGWRLVRNGVTTPAEVLRVSKEEVLSTANEPAPDTGGGNGA